MGNKHKNGKQPKLSNNKKRAAAKRTLERPEATTSVEDIADTPISHVAKQDLSPFAKEIRDYIANNANTTLANIAKHFDIDLLTTSNREGKRSLALRSEISALAANGLINSKTKDSDVTYFIDRSIGTILARYRAPANEERKEFHYLQPVSWPDGKGIERPNKITVGKVPSIKNGDDKPLKDGDMVLIKVRDASKRDDNDYTANVVDRIGHELAGHIFTTPEGVKSVKPANRNKHYSIPLPEKMARKVEDGDLVLFKLDADKRTQTMPTPVLLENYGPVSNPANISPAVAAEFNLSQDFNEKVMAELDSVLNRTISSANRTDLRNIPFITIDDITTTDMDDAMFAEPVIDPKTGLQTGWHVIVAIADVAQYIPVGSEMDKEAQHRGNTNYLPGYRCDMIPSELAVNKCSLVPDEDRSCLAMHMYTDMGGNLQDYTLQRGIMQSRAKLHHKQVEAAMKGDIDDQIAPYMDQVKALYKAYAPMKKAALLRGKLGIDSAEQKIEYNAEGEYVDISKRYYMEINSVIEEFMVLANVAAAKILIDKGYPGVYRLLEEPSEQGIKNWAPELEAMGYTINPEKDIRKEMLKILEESRKNGEAEVVHPMVIRMQQKAVYGVDEELGHFALALGQYAHFTSPIRRYADLVVHRLLIDACNLGKDGLPKNASIGQLQGISDHISNRERLAKNAEREARKRFTTLWMEQQVREHVAQDGIDPNSRPSFKVTIVDVEENGVIVELDKNGVRGMIPIEYLPGMGNYKYVKQYKALVTRVASNDNGNKTYTDYMYQRGGKMDVTIADVDLTTSTLRFQPRFAVGACLQRFENTLRAELGKTSSGRRKKEKTRGESRRTKGKKRNRGHNPG